jgi:hypothetical protein
MPRRILTIAGVVALLLSLIVGIAWLRTVISLPLLWWVVEDEDPRLLRTFFVLFGIAIALRLLARRLAPPPARPGFCPQCDYDLTGNQSGVCPECGSTLLVQVS